FAKKSLAGKARSRPDLVRQVLDKARREGLLTTIEAAFNRLDQPMPLGYSSAGTIAAVGEGLQGFKVGDRVACAGGGYAVHAEYAIVPQNLLVPLPGRVDFESAAFTTLGAIALHGFRLAQPQLGERVAVIGLGLLGLLTVGIARVAGCRVLGVDLAPERVAMGTRAGAVAVKRDHAEEAAQSLSQGRGVDAVLICADTPSNDPVTLAGTIARDRARVVAVGAVGLGIPRKPYFEKELTFLVSRSYGPGRYDPAYEEGGQDYPIGYVRWTEGRNLEAFVDLLADGRLDVHPLITHRFPIENAPEAYDLITGKTGEAFLGVVLTYESAKCEVRSAKLPVSNTPRTARSTLHPAPRTPHIELGILGAGNFATAVLLPALKRIPNIELAGIASTSGLSAQHAANKFGIHYATSDENRILDDPEINAIAILTRHNLHARQVVAALAAGKHVFCEKPLAINNDELDKIINNFQLTIHNSPSLTVGFNRRFAPLTQKLHAFLKDRTEPLVAHYRVNAGYLPLTHWLHDPEQGGGRIIGEACHFIDLCVYLAGAPPPSVYARAVGRDPGVDDSIVTTLGFSDGSVAVIEYLARTASELPKERFEVSCDGRTARCDNYRSTVITGE
ncbi:MAG: bi-domain-containing oxidoreductase, partial [Anaerolineales bacterium]